MVVSDNGLETYDPVSNDGEPDVEIGSPYTVHFRVEGTAAFLFHRWSNEAVAEKATAAKGSAAKKTDNLASYVYRADNGELAIPAEYFRMSLIGASRFKQDPRSPRKSAMDLFRAGVAAEDELCTLGTDDWDYLDSRRVQVQRNGVTRVRPAMRKGWVTTVTFLILLPEYIDRHLLLETITQAGRLIGVGDFRPTFGRYQVTSFDVMTV